MNWNIHACIKCKTNQCLCLSCIYLARNLHVSKLSIFHWTVLLCLRMLMLKIKLKTTKLWTSLWQFTKHYQKALVNLWLYLYMCRKNQLSQCVRPCAVKRWLCVWNAKRVDAADLPFAVAGRVDREVILLWAGRPHLTICPSFIWDRSESRAGVRNRLISISFSHTRNLLQYFWRIAKNNYDDTLMSNKFSHI